ncbi:MAG: HD domain-containing phosphohydrolase [Eubacterium sp.]|nr:HD domain-containing phosphohydrolase [Eubacterium sp.]
MKKMAVGRISRSLKAGRKAKRTGTQFQINLQRLFVMAIGIAINVVANYIMYRLDLPLYLDTIGTIAVSAVSGYLYGATAAVTTNVLCSIYQPISLYYTSVSVFIALLTAFFMHAPKLQKKRFIPLLIFLLALIGGGLGTAIQWALTGGPYYSDVSEVAAAVAGEGTVGYTMLCILISIGLDLVDKGLSVGLAFLLAHALPKRVRVRMWNNSWMQRPLTAEEMRDQKKRTKARKTQLNRRIFFMLLATAILLVTVQSIISMKIYEENIYDEYKTSVEKASKFVAACVDGDMVEEYLKSGQTLGGCNRRGYQQTRRTLENACRNMNNMKYIYVYKIKDDGVYIVFDVDPEEKDTHVNQHIDIDPSFEPYKADLLAGKEIPIIESNDRYGHLLTSYTPIFDSEGTCVAYAGADIAYASLDAYSGSYIFRILIILLGFFLLLLSCGLWLTKFFLVQPINAIAISMDDFAVTEVDQKTLDQKVKNFREIRVKTGDEVEFMYDALCRMMTAVAEQMRDLRHYTEATAQMQNGLIITMADMVESRDSDTGAHIQKTAAYVKIILEGLKKKGYYAEKLTPKYMSDAVISAPLHDVGKINVPDAVLNKPGKLTDEEYAIIKTHTTAGREIIERAIDTVHGENYLKEARNMAAYHHERWDGKGYPEGLHGEVIPLSARVMAVADVFDALTSKRVYKPAFPPEEALRIIQEGSGTQFDPKCVEAFFDSLTEVKVILKKYNGV